MCIKVTPKNGLFNYQLDFTPSALVACNIEFMPYLATNNATFLTPSASPTPISITNFAIAMPKATTATTAAL